MKTSALIQGKPTLLATAHGHGQVRIYELTEKWVRQKAELRTKVQWVSLFRAFLFLLDFYGSSGHMAAVARTSKRNADTGSVTGF